MIVDIKIKGLDKEYPAEEVPRIIESEPDLDVCYYYNGKGWARLSTLKPIIDGAEGEEVVQKLKAHFDQLSAEPKKKRRHKRIGIWPLFFSLHGRITRKEFWPTFLIVFLLIGVSYTLGALVLDDQTPFYITLVALVWPICALSTKRLHDRGRTGIWLMLSIFMLGFGLMLRFFFLSAGLGFLMYFFFGAWGLMSIWLLMEMTLPGEFGGNDFGGDPIQWKGK